MLQAETQQELTSWLDVFEEAKRAALDSTSSSSSQAFAIIPSTATTTESKYHDILTNRPHFHEESVSLGFDKSQQSAASNPVRPSMDERGNAQKGPQASGLSALVTASTHTFVATPANLGPGQGLAHAATFNVGSVPSTPIRSTTLAPLTLANTASPKSLAKAAAVTATRSPLDVYGSRPTLDRSTASRHRKTLSLDTGFNEKEDPFEEDSDALLPDDYPELLKTQDSHFRTLFPAAPENLPLLMVLRASWVTKTKESYPGRCYITAKTIYFYSHYFGMEFKTSIDLNTIFDVTGRFGKDCDEVNLQLEPESPVEGQIDQITLRLFIEPGRVVQKRLTLLVNNVRGPRASAFNSRELLKRLENLAEEQEIGRRESLVDTLESPIQELYVPSLTTESVLLISSRKHSTFRSKVEQGKFKGVMLTLPSQPVTYSPPGMTHIAVEKDFDLSAKALFHLVFGDRSIVFQTLYLERRAQDIVQNPWVPAEGESKFQREFSYQAEYKNAFRKFLVEYCEYFSDQLQSKESRAQ